MKNIKYYQDKTGNIIQISGNYSIDLEKKILEKGMKETTSAEYKKNQDNLKKQQIKK